METSLLNSVRDVRAHEGQILQRSGIPAVLGREPSCAGSLHLASIGVAEGLQSTMPARWRRTNAYCRYESTIPDVVRVMEMLRKNDRAPRSVRANSEWSC